MFLRRRTVPLLGYRDKAARLYSFETFFSLLLPMIISVIISFLVPDIASYYDGKLISGKVIVKPLKQG